MRVLQLAPIVAVFAVGIALLVTAVWHERLYPYESPCIVSWDENQGSAGPTTLCILDEQAARREKRATSFDPR